jgi:hypothetical protein
MYFDNDGAPWDFPQWKELTGIVHGLFPKDNKHLPKGWTCSIPISSIQSLHSTSSALLRSLLNPPSGILANDVVIRVLGFLTWEGIPHPLPGFE